MVQVVINRNHFNSFMSGFSAMDDLVLHANEETQRIYASGTADRAFFINRWAGADVVEGGNIVMGQIGTIISLVKDLPQTEENEIRLSCDGDTLTIMSGGSFFRIPTLASATSSAGVEQLLNTLEESRGSDYARFGQSDFAYKYQFESNTVRALQKIGSSINSGALFCLIVSGDELVYVVQRDGIRIEHTIEAIQSDCLEEETSIWFGSWLLDALKAMPSGGVIHLSCGADTPLLLRHEAVEGQEHGTTVIVAPRQEAE